MSHQAYSQIDPGSLQGKQTFFRPPVMEGLPKGPQVAEGILGPDGRPLDGVPFEFNGIIPGGNPAGQVADWAVVLDRCTITVDQFMGTSFPERRSIIGDWFFEGDLGFVYADRGVGKTMLGLSLARLATKGGEVGPWKSVGNINTIFVDGEMQNELTKERFRELDLLQNDRLLILHHEQLFHYGDGRVLNLAGDLVRSCLLGMISRRECRLLILDNISCLFGSLGENAAEDWEPVNQWLLQLRRQGVAVVILHHTSKAGTMRGTFKREDAATWVIKLTEATEAGQVNAAAHFISKFTKFRRGTEQEAAPLEWHYVRQPGQPTTLQVNYADVMEEFLKLVQMGHHSNGVLAEILEMSKSSVSKLAMKAQRLGKIVIRQGKYQLPS